MKLALVSPTPLPPVFGGMDRLLQGLTEALRLHHPTDLVTIPFDERSREGVLQGYLDFYNLDLSAYDRIITYKAPAYMVRHPNQVGYLSHRLRVFYDQYEPNGVLHARMRDMIHFMDNWALDKRRVPHLFTVGETVSRRLLKFGNIASTPLHHPTTFQPALRQTGEYFLSVGRLHPWKRVDLVIRAFRQAKVDCPLLIVGEGPQETELRELAAKDERIRFVGKVDDHRLAAVYSSAIAVIFPPISEDMGLITFESFLSGKPVITTTDAGEPALIVSEGRTGWIAEPRVESLASAIERAWAARRDEERIAEHCTEWMKPVTWERLTGELLRAGDTIEQEMTTIAVSNPATPAPAHIPSKSDGRIRLLVTDNQIIDPPLGGGRVRILELYRNMPDDFETIYIGAFDYPGPVARDQQLAPNFREILTPLTSPHFRLHNLLARLTKGDATVDVTMPLLGAWTPRHRRLIETHLPNCDLLIGAHPWMFPFFPATEKPIIYDSQNCEALLKPPMLRRTWAGRWLARKVEQAESLAVRTAQKVLACSEADATAFCEIYGIPMEKVILAPNGVDCARIRPANHLEREEARARLNLNRPTIAIFTGSNYLPNLEGAQLIIREIAPRHPDVDFMIVGGVGEMFRQTHPSESIPANVHLPGFVSSETLHDGYRAADLALNPMRQGSGTNIKMLDYLAAGLPILTTPVGARGIQGESKRHWIAIPPENFAGAFCEFVTAGRASWPELSRMARHLAENAYDWRHISAKVAGQLRALVARSHPKADTR